MLLAIQRAISVTVICICLLATTAGAQESEYHFEPQHSSGIHENGYNYFFGENLPDTTVSGSVIIEQNGFMPHYFLDTNLDLNTDYMLAFGPWWYTPETINCPNHGESITVSGKVHDSFNGYVVIIVEELNGAIWRDLSEGNHWSGSWIDRVITDSTYIYCPVDSASFINFPPGHMGFGGMWGNKYFVDMNRLPLDLMPESPDREMVLGYHFEFINESGNDMMHGN